MLHDLMVGNVKVPDVLGYTDAFVWVNGTGKEIGG